MTEIIIDVKNKRLGRVASEVAKILQGKHDPNYEARLEGKDSVRIKNIKEITLSGRKESNKVYYRHAGALGHLKVRKFKDVFLKNPSWILRHAVRLMLPKNRLQKRRLKRLIIEN